MITDNTGRLLLSPSIRTLVIVTGVIDLIIGLAFLLAPELQVNLWPTPISPLLSRFIGSIVIANGVGAFVAAWGRTWEGARALVTVALVYGAIVLIALLYHLLAGGAPLVFWLYALTDAVFLGPIVYIYWRYESLRPR